MRCRLMQRVREVAMFYHCFRVTETMNKIYVLILSFMVSVCQSAVLKSLMVTNDPGKTSIVCTFSSIPFYKSFLLSSPARAVVDLEKTTSKLNFKTISVGQGLVQHLRGGYPNPNRLRLVFELNGAADIKMMDWKTGMNGAQGIRIDLISRTASKQLAARPSQQREIYEPTPHIYQPPPSALIPSDTSLNKVHFHHNVAGQKPIAIRHAPGKGLRDVVVVIDAGHGGKDPGAMGPRRNVEKNVVLSIAHKLKQRINSQPGMRAVMTRNGDYYVGLRERLNIARKYNADLFVSIHADAFNNRHSSGASVYALSSRGATSEAARWLAEKENYSELGGIDLSGLDDNNGLIRTVLLDLSQTATINSGLQIGESVLQHLDRITTLHHNKVEQARFVVLKSPDIPSILVETGFITNPREEFNLTSPAYQMRLSQAIFEGINRFFLDSPPHGTRMEAMVDGGKLSMAKADIPRVRPTVSQSRRLKF